MTRVQADRLDVELKSREEHLAKLRNALNQARSNREYSAILTELNISKADNTKIENEELELMKTIEADEAEVQSLTEQIEKQKEQVNEVRQKSAAESEKWENKIADVQKEWDEAADGIPADVLDIFNRIADTYDGEALAEAEIQNEKTGVYNCGGCFMRVPDEIVNQLMTNDEVIRCSNCSRVLVLGSEEL